MWWKLFHSPKASGWTNVLTLAQLLFSLPVSNGKLERVFSTMKLIKAEKRSSMSNETLDDLLAINIDGVSVEDFDADHSIILWWKSKTRRPNQQPRKTYKRSRCEDQDIHSSTDTDSGSSDDVLRDWDNWIDSDS